jgi:hypothetical protein
VAAQNTTAIPSLFRRHPEWCAKAIMTGGPVAADPIGNRGSD